MYPHGIISIKYPKEWFVCPVSQLQLKLTYIRQRKVASTASAVRIIMVVAGYRHNLLYSNLNNYQPSQGEDVKGLFSNFIIFHLVSVNVESDGLIFDPAQITSRTQNGVAVLRMVIIIITLSLLKRHETHSTLTTFLSRYGDHKHQTN